LDEEEEEKDEIEAPKVDSLAIKDMQSLRAGALS